MSKDTRVTGKLLLLTAAYDDRMVAALPSCGGALGTAMGPETLRRDHSNLLPAALRNITGLTAT